MKVFINGKPVDPRDYISDKTEEMTLSNKPYFNDIEEFLTYKFREALAKRGWPIDT